MPWLFPNINVGVAPVLPSHSQQYCSSTALCTVAAIIASLQLSSGLRNHGITASFQDPFTKHLQPEDQYTSQHPAAALSDRQLLLPRTPGVPSSAAALASIA
jgi:hypothetical protein